MVAFDLGAIAERLRAAGLGMLLPLDLSSRQINDRLLGRAAEHRNPRAYVQTTQSIKGDDAKIERTKGIKAMKPSVDELAKEEGLSASVQLLPLPSGLYLFSVKAAAPIAERPAGQLSLPAMHVGLGPGVRSEQVEFVAGPGTEGTWLFAQGDVLVAKVNGTGATLILTSVRSSIGEVLAIAVERLEGRAQAAAAVPTQSENISVKLPACRSFCSRRSRTGCTDVEIRRRSRSRCSGCTASNQDAHPLARRCELCRCALGRTRGSRALD